MESPSYSGPTRKKSNIGWIIGIVVAVLFLCCGFAGFAAFSGFKTVMGGTGSMLACGNSVSDYRDAILAYAKKHNGKLPPAKTWQDDVSKFLVRSTMPTILKSDSQVGDPDEYCDAKAPSAVCYNSDLAGKSLSSLNPESDAILLFEVPGQGKNKSSKFEVQPFSTSPKIVMDQRRGWIEQPLYGTAFSINQTGQKAPIAKVDQRGSSMQVGN